MELKNILSDLGRGIGFDNIVNQKFNKLTKRI